MRIEELDDNPYFSSRIEIFSRNLFRQCQATPNDWLFIEPYSIGDAYHTLSLLKAFREKWVRGNERIFFLCNQRCTALAKIFPFAEAIIGGNLNPIEFQLETLAEQQWPFGPGKPIIMALDMHLRGKLFRLIGAGKATSLDIKKMFLHLPIATVPAHPVITVQARQNAEKLAVDQGVVKGNSLIIINHGATYKSMPDAFWQPVIATAKKKGLAVFSDTTTGQPVLPDTMPVKISLEDLIPVCEFAGTAAVLRSGLVDVLSTAKCRFLTVYPGAENARYISMTTLSDSILTLAANGMQTDLAESEKEKPVFIAQHPDFTSAGNACAAYLA